MQYATPSVKYSSLVLVAALLLAACGGGGGPADSSNAGTSSTVTTTTSTTIAAPVSTIVTTVPPSNYTGGTVQSDAFIYMNAVRVNCGFGALLQQNTHMDVAAQAHADWMMLNRQISHTEDSSLYPTGFYGTTHYDRATVSGYAWATYNEGALLTNDPRGAPLGQEYIMNLLVAPYHGKTLLAGYRDVGIGSATIPADNFFPVFNWINIDYGTTAARPTQLLGGNDLVTYPCAGETGVLSKSYQNEVPAPVFGRNLQNSPIGHPIYIKVRDGQTLVLTSYSLQRIGVGISLPLILLNRASDTNARITDDSIAILMPDSPLAINSSYVFTATGTNNGQAVNINFTFSTGAF